MVQQKNIPELRFPEFDGKWMKDSFENICCDVMYGMNASATTYDCKHKYLRITDIDEGTREFKPNPLTSPAGNIDSQFKLQKGDIVFARTGASVGKSYLYKEVDGDLYFAGFLIKFSIRDANPYFVYSQTLRYPFNKWVKVMSMRSGQPGINAEEYKSYKFNLPTLPEQQKIASFFTAIDKKISQLKQKKALLEQYKKGVMQKIFAQQPDEGGSRTPLKNNKTGEQIRFKDDNGQEFPKWEKKKMGNIGKTYSGLAGKSKDDFGQGMPFIQYKQIFDDSRINLSRFGFVQIKDGEKQNCAEYGDVLFTISSETPDEVGTASVLLDKVDKVYLNSFSFGYRCSQAILIPSFSRYLFRNELFRKEINMLAQGSTRYNMSKNELMKLELFLPTIKEQTKIANFLSSIDNKINHTQTQIEKADLWKKGLLQKMFV